MTAAGQCETADASVERGTAIVEDALAKVLIEDHSITPSIEAEVQNALDILRRSSCDADCLTRVEQISAMLFTLARTKVNGRPNLYASQMLRLRRFVS